MVNVTQGPVWSIDTAAGIVVDHPIYLESVIVTFKVASAGTLVLSDVEEGAPNNTILTAKTLGAASAAVDQLTYQYFYGCIVRGLHKTTVTNIDSIQVVTK